MALVDIVTVSYNNADTLRASIEPLTRLDWVQVIVVDNDSADATLTTVSDLPVHAIDSGANLGFAGGCNVGWRAGESPYVLFLNPDAAIEESSIRSLVDALESRPSAALVAPRILGDDGELQHSLRRFPRLRSTYAQAFFLHRLAPRAAWTDEKVRDEKAYQTAGPHDWVSGACMLVRREVLETLGGWDDGFFFYCEDIDLCRRIHDLGREVLFEPAASIVHEGGGSAPRSAMLPMLAASRVRYARLHRGRLGALAERFGIALEAATHMIVGRGGRAARLGHAKSLRISLAREQVAR